MSCGEETLEKKKMYWALSIFSIQSTRFAWSIGVAYNKLLPGEAEGTPHPHPQVHQQQRKQATFKEEICAEESQHENCPLNPLQTLLFWSNYTRKNHPLPRYWHWHLKSTEEEDAKGGRGFSRAACWLEVLKAAALFLLIFPPQSSEFSASDIQDHRNKDFYSYYFITQ